MLYDIRLGTKQLNEFQIFVLQYRRFVVKKKIENSSKCILLILTIISTAWIVIKFIVAVVKIKGFIQKLAFII